MSDEDKKEGGTPNPEPEDIKPDKDGKYPESVSWKQYVGVKESLGGKLDTLRQEKESLEEKIKNAPTAEAVEKLQGELKEAKEKLETTSNELSTLKEQTTGEKRDTLIKRGVPEDKVKDMSVQELNAAITAIGAVKPAPDMSGGGGGGVALTGKPMDLATRAYASSNKK